MLDNRLATGLFQLTLLEVLRFVVVSGEFLNDHREGNVLKAESDLFQVLLCQRTKLCGLRVDPGVLTELMIIDDEVLIFGVGLLGFPVVIGDLADR